MDIPLVTIALIAANVLVSIKGFNDNRFFDRYKFQISAIRRGERSRMLSSAFLHVDWMHLFFNMFTLYIFSDNVIGALGTWGFVLLYFGSLIFGSLLALNFNKNNPFYSAVGASGAVTGVVFSAILLDPSMQLMLIPIPIPIPGYIFGIAYLLYSIYGMKKQLGNIGHSAHLGGATGGYVLTLLLRPSIVMSNFFTVFLLAVPIVWLFTMEKKEKL